MTGASLAELARGLRAQAQALIVLAVDADRESAARLERLAKDGLALAARLDGPLAGSARQVIEAARLRTARTARVIAAATRSLRLVTRAA